MATLAGPVAVADLVRADSAAGAAVVAALAVAMPAAKAVASAAPAAEAGDGVARMVAVAAMWAAGEVLDGARLAMKMANDGARDATRKTASGTGMATAIAAPT